MSDPTVPFASFVGADLHKCSVTLRAVNPAGEPIASLTRDTKCVDRIEQWLLALPRPSHLAVEAVGFVEWFIDRFRACVEKMDIADATELANRRGKRRKTDHKDALDVALRLARGECPLAHGHLLKSVPGIDEIWACVIAAEVGEFSRFPNADALEFRAGMTADVKESTGRTQSGHITKAGSPTLRWAICKAAVTLCRSDAKQEATRQRLLRRIGKPKANVAMGRRLLRILFAMVRDGALYQGQPPTGHERAANKARLNKRNKAA